MLSFIFWRNKIFVWVTVMFFAVYLYSCINRPSIFMWITYGSIYKLAFMISVMDVTRLVTQTHTRGTAFDCDQHLVMGFEVMGGANQSKHNLMRHLYLYCLRLRICRWHYFIPVISWKQKPRAKSGFYLYKVFDYLWCFLFYDYESVIINWTIHF